MRTDALAEYWIGMLEEVNLVSVAKFKDWLRYRIYLIIFLAPHYPSAAFAQDKAIHDMQELSTVRTTDSTLPINLFQGLISKYDSLDQLSDRQLRSLKIQSDSLAQLNIATDRIKEKVDSVTRQKQEQLYEIEDRIATLLSSVKDRIDSLALPPQLRDRAEKIASRVRKLRVPGLEALDDWQQKLGSAIPGLESNGLLTNIPSASIPSVNIPSIAPSALQDNLPVADDINEIVDKIKSSTNDISRLPTDFNTVVEAVETQTTNISMISDVQDELTQVRELSAMSSTLKDQEAMKKELLSKVQEQATDHFAGQQEQLKKAMDAVAKYKMKFPTIKSLNDLPKRPPNAMKGKPLVERIVPGLAMQLQKKNDDIVMDFNLYAGYRFTQRLTAGGGWNQRWGVNIDKRVMTGPNTQIYGPRLFSEYKLRKGFSPRIEVEAMNTFVPPYLQITRTDPGHRDWVWGAFVGMKKEYKLVKKVNGTAMIMLRLFDPHRKSPYADVVNARFGFELPMKKQTKAAKA